MKPKTLQIMECLDHLIWEAWKHIPPSHEDMNIVDEINEGLEHVTEELKYMLAALIGVMKHWIPESDAIEQARKVVDGWAGWMTDSKRIDRLQKLPSFTVRVVYYPTTTCGEAPLQKHWQVQAGVHTASGRTLREAVDLILQSLHLSENGDSADE